MSKFLKIDCTPTSKNPCSPTKLLRNLKRIWLEEIGEEISDEQAMELGLNLLSIFDAVYRPIKKEWLEEILKRRKKEMEQKTNRIKI